MEVCLFIFLDCRIRGFGRHGGLVQEKEMDLELRNSHAGGNGNKGTNKWVNRKVLYRDLRAEQALGCREKNLCPRI